MGSSVLQRLTSQRAMLIVGLGLGLLAGQLASAQQPSSDDAELPALNAPELNPPQLNAPELAPPQVPPQASSEAAPSSPLDSPPPADAPAGRSAPPRENAGDANVGPANFEELPSPEMAPPSESEGARRATFNDRLVIDADEPQVVLRGPVHESLAAVIDIDPTPSALLTEQPPPLLDELPPRVKPSGGDVQWIPGYWAWDDSQQDFLWISGIWRTTPPGQRWVPGYWSLSSDGARWVSGFWMDAAADRLHYLPAPPATLERGPASLADGDDRFWIPGCWQYQDERYRWRSGYWYAHKENWIWTAERHVWTPQGTVLVNGYWDYPLAVRGLLFAPLAAATDQQHIYMRSFTPDYVIHTPTAMLHLFVRDGDNHFLFGDYYALASEGIVDAWIPRWISGGDDPLATYYRWQYDQQGTDIIDRLLGWHDYFLQRPALRPPITPAQQAQFISEYENWKHLAQSVLGFRLLDIVRQSDADSVQWLSDQEQLRVVGETAVLQRLATRRSQVEKVTGDQTPALTISQLELPPAPLRTRPRDDGDRVWVLRPATEGGRTDQGLLLVVPQPLRDTLAPLPWPEAAYGGGPSGVMVLRAPAAQEDERNRGGLRERLRERRARRR